MVRAVLMASLLLGFPQTGGAQATSVLHIRVVLTDDEGARTPVAHHTLLISDNPSTAAPRVVITTADGTADVKLRPGNYTVESDRPVSFRGKAYQWTQLVDIVSGRDAVLDLTLANAEGVPLPSASSPETPLEADPSTLLSRWQESVASLWTSLTHASAFVVDARGLAVTSQRVIGTDTKAELQLTPTIKVEARVLASDPARDVAVLWVNPASIASIKPVPLGCAEAMTAPITEGQEIVAIVAPLIRQKDVIAGTVTRVVPGAILADFTPDADSAGGPVWRAERAVGLTSVVIDEDAGTGDVRIVPAADACAVIAAAEKRMQGASPPSDARLPLEPKEPLDVNALEKAVEGRAGSLNPYQTSSSDFDVAFITPLLVYGAQHQAEQAAERQRSRARTPDPQMLIPPLMDFGNWSRFVESLPPVLLVRVRPKLGEGFWTKVGRGAARTQGMAIPPIKRFQSSFLRLRAFCGSAEVTPIHPFKIAQRISETNTIYEGLYVFDPGALGAQCGTVKLELYSEKEPTKADTHVVETAIIQQIRRDFEVVRSAGSSPAK